MIYVPVGHSTTRNWLDFPAETGGCLPASLPAWPPGWPTSRQVVLEDARQTSNDYNHYVMISTTTRERQMNFLIGRADCVSRPATRVVIPPANRWPSAAAAQTRPATVIFRRRKSTKLSPDRLTFLCCCLIGTLNVRAGLPCGRRVVPLVAGATVLDLDLAAVKGAERRNKTITVGFLAIINNSKLWPLVAIRDQKANETTRTPSPRRKFGDYKAGASSSFRGSAAVVVVVVVVVEVASLLRPSRCRLTRRRLAARDEQVRRAAGRLVVVAVVVD